jgi:hypothetical protein
MKALLIQRAVVVAVARDSPQSGIAVEAVAADRVAQQGEKVLISEVVDPGSRSFGSSDNVLFVRIIKKTGKSSLFIIRCLPKIFGL